MNHIYGNIFKESHQIPIEIQSKYDTLKSQVMKMPEYFYQNNYKQTPKNKAKDPSNFSVKNIKTDLFTTFALNNKTFYFSNK